MDPAGPDAHPWGHAGAGDRIPHHQKEEYMARDAERIRDRVRQDPGPQQRTAHNFAVGAVQSRLSPCRLACRYPPI